jgi:hypothetical protein
VNNGKDCRIASYLDRIGGMHVLSVKSVDGYLYSGALSDLCIYLTSMRHLPEIQNN